MTTKNAAAAADDIKELNREENISSHAVFVKRIWKGLIMLSTHLSIGFGLLGYSIHNFEGDHRLLCMNMGTLSTIAVGVTVQATDVEWKPTASNALEFRFKLLKPFFDGGAALLAMIYLRNTNSSTTNMEDRFPVIAGIIGADLFVSAFYGFIARRGFVDVCAAITPSIATLVGFFISENLLISAFFISVLYFMLLGYVLVVVDDYPELLSLSCCDDDDLVCGQSGTTTMGDAARLSQQVVSLEDMIAKDTETGRLQILEDLKNISFSDNGGKQNPSLLRHRTPFQSEDSMSGSGERGLTLSAGKGPELTEKTYANQENCSE